MVVDIHWRVTGIWNSLPTFSRGLEIKHSSHKHLRGSPDTLTTRREERLPSGRQLPNHLQEQEESLLQEKLRVGMWNLSSKEDKFCRVRRADHKRPWHPLNR